MTDCFPALLLAMLKVAKAEDAATLWSIVARDPVGVPYFASPELYLQRRAALAWLTRYGWPGFEGERLRIRPELFFYLAVLHPPTEDERLMLLATLDDFPEHDLQGNEFSVRAWLEENKLPAWQQA